jgi:AcrR family transcriptional regulator
VLTIGRKKRDKEGSAKALLEAAVQVFSERGYDAATTREVAKRAGVSEGLIQRYFDGKAGLLVAILQSFAAEEAEMGLAQLPYRDSLEEEILQILTSTCKGHQEHNSFIKVVLSRAIVDPKIGQQLRTVVHERRHPLVIARLGHYQSKGLIPKDVDLESLAYGISAIGFSIGFMAPNVFGYEPEKLERIARDMSRILGRGV